MSRTLNGTIVEQTTPSSHMIKRAEKWMNSILNSRSRNKPGYWVKLTKRIYAYREHTGDITYWRAS